LNSTLHVFAGLILLCFSISHFGFLHLTNYDISLGFTNPVFPFLTNSDLYLIAGMFEGVTAVLCIAYRGRDLVNVAILTFVAIILCYRWAFFFVGGTKCNCLGLLGALLHSGKVMERRLPIIALVLLCCATTPWLYRKGKGLLKSAGQIFVIFLLLAAPQFSRADPTIRIDGILDASRYNAVLGTPFSNTTVQVGFTVAISNDKWQICVTNLKNDEWWGEIFCDSTNIYTLNPEGDLWLSAHPTSTNHVFSTISTAPLYIAPVDDTLGLATLYVTYALSPRHIVPGGAGGMQLPLPWNLGRSSPKGNGFRWIVTTNSDFIESFQIIRDKSLDLSDRDEMLRPDIDFPHEVGERNSYLVSLNYRRSIPNGYLQAEFASTSTYDTNHTRIPKSSEMKYYFYSSGKHPYIYPIYKSYLKATNLALLNDFQFELPPPDIQTYVHDYRYKKLANNRLFDYADYKLQAGEKWKAADDPSLMQQREYYLEHGPRLFSFVTRKMILVWLLFASIMAPIPIILILKQKKQKQKTNETID
jgi:hypothetical protein